jgi:hypothetical protein
MQVLHPLTIFHLRLAPRDMLEVRRIDEGHAAAACFSQLIDGNPVYTGRFHGHCLTPAGRQPIRQREEGRGKRAKRAHPGRQRAGSQRGVQRAWRSRSTGTHGRASRVRGHLGIPTRSGHLANPAQRGLRPARAQPPVITTRLTRTSLANGLNNTPVFARS